jgi:hypothetical protein
MGEGEWLGARAGVDGSGAIGRWRVVVGCGGGLHGKTRGPKATGEGSSARGSVRRVSKGMRGIIGHARDQQEQWDHMSSRGVDGGGEGPGAGGDAWT